MSYIQHVTLAGIASERIASIAACQSPLAMWAVMLLGMWAIVWAVMWAITAAAICTQGFLT